MKEDLVIKRKIAQVKDLAVSSVFFPFTEPTVHNPVTGRKVSGDYDREFYAKKSKYILGK